MLTELLEKNFVLTNIEFNKETNKLNIVMQNGITRLIFKNLNLPNIKRNTHSHAIENKIMGEIQEHVVTLETITFDNEENENL